jgi:hypothetical protein
MTARRAAAAREPSARYLAHAGPVLVDSGPLIALFNADDRWHAPVRGWLQANPAAPLLSTWCVATEVCALLARRIHNDAALDFLRWCQRGGLALDRAVDGSLTEVLRISERFAPPPPARPAARCSAPARCWPPGCGRRSGHSPRGQQEGRAGLAVDALGRASASACGDRRVDQRARHLMRAGMGLAHHQAAAQAQRPTAPASPAPRRPGSSSRASSAKPLSRSRRPAARRCW